MFCSKFVSAASLATIGLTVVCGTAAAQTRSRSGQQVPAVVAHSTDMSVREATLHLYLSDGRGVVFSLAQGAVTLNGQEMAEYAAGGELERSWRGLLAQARQSDTDWMLREFLGWSIGHLNAETLEELAAQLAPLGSLEEQRELGRQQSSKAPAESALAATRTPGTTSGVQRNIVGRVAGDITGLLAAFVAMCSLGFGLVFFAPRQLEVVADTVHDSFGRSFFAGLLAQPLIIPVFGLLMLGLALTLVGILVIPFAAVAFAAVTVLGVLGGYLAVARSIGEAYLRRRMSLGHAVGGWLSYRYVVYGLVALFTIWLPATLVGWAPVAGQIFTVSAILISWIVATAGFGATILSRAGIRGTFTRRFEQQFSDEYLFRTPQATPVAPPHRHPDRFEP